MPTNPNIWTGTGLSDQADGTNEGDTLIGLAGNDTLSGQQGDDTLYGDYSNGNLLAGPSGALSMSDYGASGNWVVTDLANGHQEMTQEIATEIGGVYNLSLDLAANFAGGQTDGAVEILVDDVVVAEIASQSGAFSTHEVQFAAQNSDSKITLRSVSGPDDGPAIDTSGPIFHYAKDIEINGQTVTVSAFADGQSNLYQALNGTLHVFDVDSQTYEQAGAQGTVNVNAMGFNAQDDLLYAIAVDQGVDALGQVIESSDLVMIDAQGNSYRVGETPYRAWTGDFDDKGNLWTFQSSMDHIAVIDVDTQDADGNPDTIIHKLPKALVNTRVYDVAFDAGSQCFYGVARPSAEGADTVMLVIDISGGSPEFSTIPITQTVFETGIVDGAPQMTFGAAFMDADGTLFVGGNSGDHDMDDSTGSSGAIYQVVIDQASGTASLHLVAHAPRSRSNDGAADPTAENAFAPVDMDASVLLRDLSLVATTDGPLSYDDTLSGNAGNDTLFGGIGDDILNGGSSNGSSDLISVYGDDGLRYDQFGNLLPDDNDILMGGAGSDSLSGSAGHDMLDGGEGDDTLHGGSGSDTLFGGAGQDALHGGSQADTLSGDGGDDRLEGGSGDDVLLGGTGDDTLLGGSDNDSLSGEDGADTLSGGSGHDTLNGGNGNDTLDGGSGDDVLNGGKGADNLKGGSDSDILSGEDGNDLLNGGAGDDALDGGIGNDRLKGGSGNDSLTGGEGKDYLSAGSGDDVLFGGAGKDTLYLGAGNDIASGGAGSDRFVFRSDDLDGGTDVITDFSVTDRDRLDLRSLNLDADGADMNAWFTANTSIVNGDDVQVALANGTTLLLEDTAADLGQLFDCFQF